MDMLCERCQHRADSRRRVADFVALRARPGVAGAVCDPAPKAECKLHEGYGVAVGTRVQCRDFIAHTRGEAHSKAKLTEAIVVEIRKRREAGESAASIAKAYGIGRSTVNQIVSRDSWRHVP